MTITEIQEKILTDDDFVVREFDKIALYYQLKHTIRWGHKRTQDETESVAEHIYGMHILIEYFLPLIDPNTELNRTSILSLTTWHDMAEAVVSDMTTNTKTGAHKEAEKQAEIRLVHEATAHIQDNMRELFKVYEDQNTTEARFVKAIDKIEPLFHLYFLSKLEPDIRPKFDLGWTAETYREHRAPYMQHFPLLKRIDDILYGVTKAFHPTA